MYEVVIALGSNLGNRALHMLRGIQQLRSTGVQVLRHSAMYETAPAYMTDQPSYLNAAVLTRTDMPPLELLQVLKRIEAGAGRDLAGGQRFGPRPLDMDIIFYGSDSMQLGETLTVPHARWSERPFVIAPLVDLLYDSDPQPPEPSAAVPASGKQSSAGATSLTTPTGQAGSACNTGSTGCATSVRGLLQQARGLWEATTSTQACSSSTGTSLSMSGGGSSGIPTNTSCTTSNSVSSRSSSIEGGDVLRRVTPLPCGRTLAWGSHTHVMGILNVTPDSFSDGGQHTGLGSVLDAAQRMVAQGAHMLDVGGQSTRPGAQRVAAGEELARVMPVIRALKAHPITNQVPISVDTFYSQVASEAVRAGASIVNDVSGGGLDPAMHATVAELGVPYVLMHMRGDPTNMQQPHNTSYRNIVADVAAEMLTSAQHAEAAGIPAWSIILDPGLGFAKTPEGSLQLLAQLPQLRGELQGAYRHAPLLLGASRKGFLGKLIGGKPALERDAASVAAVVASIAGGADIVRVHNVGMCADGAHVADALYRRMM